MHGGARDLFSVHGEACDLLTVHDWLIDLFENLAKYRLSLRYGFTSKNIKLLRSQPGTELDPAHCSLESSSLKL
jgi:hypothetical protein